MEWVDDSGDVDVAIPGSATGRVDRHRLTTGRPEPRPLNDLSVLITGGGKGLGHAFAAELARRGAAVMITGRNRPALASAAEAMRGEGLRVAYAVADATSAKQVTDAIDRTVDTFGRVDVLINNAAVPGPLGNTWEVDPEDWWRTIETNLRGCEIAARAVLPAMVERGHGRLINMVSNAGLKRWPSASAYSVSKAALIMLTENLAVELRRTGVTVIAFDPGLLDIGITRAHLDRGHTGDPAADSILDWTLHAMRKNKFTPVARAVDQLAYIVAGEADERSGQYLTTDDDLTATQERLPAQRSSHLGGTAVPMP